MRKIIIEENSQPVLVGEWTIGAVLAAAEFLRQWIENQKISTQPTANEPPATQDDTPPE